jgi:hypothetical protein
MEKHPTAQDNTGNPHSLVNYFSLKPVFIWFWFAGI